MKRDTIITVVCIIFIAFLLYWSKFQHGKTNTEMVLMYWPAFSIPIVYYLIKKIRGMRNKK
jgi:hypothetical protein